MSKDEMIARVKQLDSAAMLMQETMQDWEQERDRLVAVLMNMGVKIPRVPGTQMLDLSHLEQRG